MKKMILIALTLPLVFIGCKDKEEKMELKKKPILVKVQKVQKGVLIKNLEYKGTVFPWKQANIGPDVSGRVERIYFKPGDKVSKGELLAQLDTTKIKLQKNQAEAALEVAKASYKDALTNYNRMKKLLEKNAISKLQYEKAELMLESSETQRKSADATLKVISYTLDNSLMKAPFSGVITSKNQEEGDIINPMMGMNASVLTLMDLNQVKIILEISSQDIEAIKVGQKCHVNVDTLKGEIFKGVVYSKNQAADPVSKTFKIEVQVKNPEMKIKAGIFAETLIEVYKQEDVIVLPLLALVEREQGNFVMVYENQRAKTRKISVGNNNGVDFEVLDGLSIGELVIIEGNYDLKEDALITTEEDNS
jgi:RND family efflux transporter MFP subunit